VEGVNKLPTLKGCTFKILFNGGVEEGAKPPLYHKRVGGWEEIQNGVGEKNDGLNWGRFRVSYKR
jgi:hypothetical protein